MPGTTHLGLKRKTLLYRETEAWRGYHAAGRHSSVGARVLVSAAKPNATPLGQGQGVLLTPSDFCPLPCRSEGSSPNWLQALKLKKKKV